MEDRNRFGTTVRYRVAVGKAQELWIGRTFVAAKVVDPKWIPVNGDEPAAHEEANRNIEDQLRERALDARDRDASARRERRRTREADASTVRVNGKLPGCMALGL